MDKLVSVIIPTYGRPEFLKRAVDSVLNQTYKNVEIIVVDDNNNDSECRIATEKTMAEYKDNKKVIYLKHEQNKNGAAARNTGIKIAKGEYIAFLDDDDEMRAERIELLYKKMETLDSMWCCCYSGFTKLKSDGTFDTCGEKRTGDLYVKALMRSLYFCPGSNLFARTENVKKIGGFDEDFARNQDLEFLARLLETGKISCICDDTLIIHYENKKPGKGASYKKLVELDELFLGKFKERIDKLDKKDRRKVYQYFALERFRYSLKTHQVKDGIKNCIVNKVSAWLFLRYVFYMVYRFVTKKSVGFNI